MYETMRRARAGRARAATAALAMAAALAVSACDGLGGGKDDPEPRYSYRSVSAVTADAGVFVSWRLFQYDYADIAFNVYRNGEKITTERLEAAYTDLADPDGQAGDVYQVEIYSGSRLVARSEKTTALPTDYLSIPIEKPTTGHLPGDDPGTYTDYTAINAAPADLDGDGVMEIVFFWEPDNQKDNSQSGKTGNVYIDAYTLDGRKVWGVGNYIDLGSNIRAGAHYQTFVVADLDGDGKAEIVVKTADGTTDTEGTVVGDADALWVNDGGYILAGPEYLSVFEGATGKLMHTTNYLPGRGFADNDGDAQNALWGDNYGNRLDRYLSCAAYLDGQHLSAVMGRGYYTRICVAAWDWDGEALTLHWYFDTKHDPTIDDADQPAGIDWGSAYEGQGNHSVMAADVDNDGADEIIYGSLTLDHDGTPLYTTGLGHGDAQHVGDLDPTRPGLEITGVHESAPYGIEMHDAATGAIIWRKLASADTGRGVSADIDPDHPGEEAWAMLNGVNIGVVSADGTFLSSDPVASCNAVIFWDGDTGRELFDGGYNYNPGDAASDGDADAVVQKAVKRDEGGYGIDVVKTFTGTHTSNGTKRNALLQADLLGDWREEVILDSADNSEIRVYTTTIPTVHDGPGAVPAKGIPALTDNRQYRSALVWQHTGYNQPPHTSWFIGYNMADIPR